MWKKNEPEHSSPEIQSEAPVQQLKERALIGASITVKGDLVGEEDLLIQGRVEGKIVLKENNVTVGSRGNLKADVHAKIVSVEGRVEGNLYGKEKIIIRKTGRVRGNLVAPRVSLEDGATFKGSIDMEAAKQPAVSQPKTRQALATPQVPSVKSEADSPRKVSVGLSAEGAPTSQR